MQWWQRHRWRAARLGRALLAVLAMAGMLGLGAEPAHADDTLEDMYEAPGSFVPTIDDDVADDDPASDETFDIFRPATLGGSSGSYDHPILIWGNGSGVEDTDEDYSPILGHLASWGYVVISPNDGSVGNGQRLRAALDHMVAENGNPSSDYFQKLDVTRIGAIGHSQGAGGVAFTTMDVAPGVIDSVVGIGFPDPWTWCWDGDPDCRDLDDPDDFLNDFPAPLFLVRGQDDDIATDWDDLALPPGVDRDCRGETEDHMELGCYTEWYQQVPGMAAKVTHDDFFGQVDHWVTYEYRGYVTAWFEYTLMNSTTARGVFAGSNPELFSNSEWNQFPGLTAVKNPI